MMVSATAPVADRSAGSTSFELVASVDGRSHVRGVLTFATARRAREQGMKAFQECGAHAHEVDCSGITASDSAGLTVLLDWLAVSRGRGCGLRYVNLPEGLLAIARISEVEELLKKGV
jgi:phospholipid transport system transporter-binding protein